MAEAPPSKSYSVVAAFDIGSYSSGYAFSFRNDPMKIQTNTGWISGSERLITHKTPTCVLLNPSVQFDSFGFDAENKYYYLVDDQKDTGWMFFQRFPLTLHNNEVHIRSVKRLKRHVNKPIGKSWVRVRY